MAALRCDKAREQLSAYLDGELSPQARLLVEEHLSGCAACRGELESLKTAAALVRGLPRSAPPEDFHAVLTSRLRAEAAAMAAAGRIRARRRVGPGLAEFWASLWSGFRRAPYRGVAVAAAVLVVLVWAGSFAFYMGAPLPLVSRLDLGAPAKEGLAQAPAGTPEFSGNRGEGTSGLTADTGKVGSSPGATGFFAAGAHEELGGASPGGASGSGQGSGEGDGTATALAVGAETGRKFILSVYMNLECENVGPARDRAVAAAEGAGGFVESLNYWTDESGRASASLTLRVPAEALTNVLGQLRSLGDVLTEQASRQDVTGQHIDLTARLNNLRLQEQRLLVLLGKAENLGDIFALENELARIRTDIEVYDSQLRVLNEQIALSTINLNLQEAGPGPGPGAGFWDRVLDAFLKSLRWMAEVAGKLVIFLAAITAPVVALAAIVWAVVAAVRARRRRAGV